MNSDKTTLGDRMKLYESVTDYELYRRMPIIIRIDGRAFHTFTRGMKEPFDNQFRWLMAQAANAVFEEFGARIAYIQSDEISLVVCPYATYTTEPPFSARIQKVCSVAASVATQAFMAAMVRLGIAPAQETRDWVSDYLYHRKATFDARCFNLQRDEVLNYLIWRQQDCRRNAVLSAGLYYLGKKAIFKLKVPEIIDEMKNQGKNYEELTPTPEHEGRFILRMPDGVDWDVLRLDTPEDKKRIINIVEATDE